MSDAKRLPCPRCKGAKAIAGFLHSYPCDLCNGTGQGPEITAADISSANITASGKLPGARYAVRAIVTIDVGNCRDIYECDQESEVLRGPIRHADGSETITIIMRRAVKL